MKKCLMVFLTAILLFSMPNTTLALVIGEHSFWKEYLTRCVGAESTFSFTQEEAQAASLDFTYWGSEYIHFNYQNGSILITGMDEGILCGDQWDIPDYNKLSSTIMEFVLNWGEDEFEEYVNDADIMIDFTDGYILSHMIDVYLDWTDWTLWDADIKLVKENIKDEDLLDIIQQHILE